MIAQNNLPAALAKLSENLKGGATPRPERTQEDVGVDYGTVSALADSFLSANHARKTQLLPTAALEGFSVHLG
jgi:hypothetical protein